MPTSEVFTPESNSCIFLAASSLVISGNIADQESTICSTPLDSATMPVSIISPVPLTFLLFPIYGTIIDNQVTTTKNTKTNIIVNFTNLFFLAISYNNNLKDFISRRPESLRKTAGYDTTQVLKL